MANCLKTQLKDSVQNDNLQTLEVLEFNVVSVTSPTDATQWLNLVDGAKEIDAEIIGNGHFVKGNSYSGGQDMGKTITIKDVAKQTQGGASAPFYYLSNGEYKVRIKSKYDCNLISPVLSYVTNIDNFKYSTIRLVKYRGGNCVGDIGSIANWSKTIQSLQLTNYNTDGVQTKYNLTGDISVLGSFNALVQVALANSYIEGDISVLTGKNNISTLRLNNTNVSGNVSALENLTNMAVLNLDLTNVTGDISSFGKMTNLTNLSVFNSKITGTIESLIAGFRTNGKTSGSISAEVFTTQGNSITFNGVQIPSSYRNQPLSWTATTITCNGETITA